MTTSIGTTASAPRSPSLALRAALAVALMIGFYVLALGIAGALVFIPWSEWHYAERVDGRILVFCLGGAGAILLGVLPRRDRFEAPGPRLTESDHPDLFDLATAVREG